MCRALALLLAVVSVSAAQRGLVSDAVPPERFQGPASAQIVTASQIQTSLTCDQIMGEPPPGVVWRACHINGGPVYVPNPCEWPGEQFAHILCHEMAHVQGWSAYHEE